MKIAVTFASAALLLCAGCNDNPPPKDTGSTPAREPMRTPAKPDSANNTSATKPALSDQDKAALRGLAGNDAQPSGGAGALPPGHPPTGGAPSPGPVTGSGDAGALPPGHPPTAGGDASASPPQRPAGGNASNLNFDAPDDWKAMPLKSAMRKAQYGIPRAANDSEDAELVIYYFGPNEGGPVMENLKRWQGQFTAADGSALPPEAGKLEKLTANGMNVTLLDISGKYAPGAMPGMADTGPHDNFRMLAAIIETPGGPWFIKATGPAATMAAQHDAIVKFTLSAKN